MAWTAHKNVVTTATIEMNVTPSTGQKALLQQSNFMR
jgi:hypothetical protein